MVVSWVLDKFSWNPNWWAWMRRNPSYLQKSFPVWFGLLQLTKIYLGLQHNSGWKKHPEFDINLHIELIASCCTFPCFGNIEEGQLSSLRSWRLYLAVFVTWFSKSCFQTWVEIVVTFEPIVSELTNLSWSKLAQCWHSDVWGGTTHIIHAGLIQGIKEFCKSKLYLDYCGFSFL